VGFGQKNSNTKRPPHHHIAERHDLDRRQVLRGRSPYPHRSGDHHGKPGADCVLAHNSFSSSTVARHSRKVHRRHVKTHLVDILPPLKPSFFQGRHGHSKREKSKMTEARRPVSADTQAILRRDRSLRALAAAAFVGGATAAVVFLPGVTVDAQGPVDPSNPYPISFMIGDANLIPLNNVNAYLVICYVAAVPTPPVPVCQPPFDTRLFKAGWRGHSLGAHEPFTVTLDDFLRLAAPAKFGGADISIIVEYQPWLFPVRQEKEFRFATQPGIDGKLYWTARAVGD
jgi:hypothetical protein